ncbi:MAG: MauE/DoxX family redox-associated membrane protein, partial [Bacteroidota bacterium]
MKVLNNVIRWLVGLLFIFSGLVKVNDPVGTAIKLHEYFDVFAVDLPALAGFFKALIPVSLPLAVFLVVLEVALGIAVLVKILHYYHQLEALEGHFRKITVIIP